MSLKLATNNAAPYNYLTIPTNKSYGAATAFVIGDRVAPGNGYVYGCTAAGTSGGSAPTWPTTTDATVTDGTVTWRCECAANNPASVSVTVDNTGSPATKDTSVQTLYLVARTYRETGISMAMVNDTQSGIDWKLSVDNTTWKDSLTSTDLPDMDALGAAVTKAVYVKAVVNNNGTVATGNYTLPDFQINCTENPS